MTVSSNIPLRVIEPRPERESCCLFVCLFVFLNICHRETNVTGATPAPSHEFFFSFGISLYFIRYIYTKIRRLNKETKMCF